MIKQLCVFVLVLWVFLFQPNIAQLQLVVTSIGIWVAFQGFLKVNRSVRREIVSSLFTQNAHVRALIVTTPSYRKYIFDKVELVRRQDNDDEYDAVRTLAEIYLNYLEHLTVEQSSLHITEGATWESTIKSTLHRSPIMREVLENDSQWYAPELLAINKIVLDEMKLDLIHIEMQIENQRIGQLILETICRLHNVENAAKFSWNFVNIVVSAPYQETKEPKHLRTPLWGKR